MGIAISGTPSDYWVAWHAITQQKVAVHAGSFAILNEWLVTTGMEHEITQQTFRIQTAACHVRFSGRD